MKSKSKEEERPYSTYHVSGSAGNTVVEALGHLLNETTGLVQDKLAKDLKGTI